MGMQMAKYIHPMGIAGAGMIMHNPHPHTHLPGYEHGDLEIAMRTERKWTKLSSAIFVFIFFAEAKTHTETPKTNTKTDIDENRHGPNTTRTWMKADDYRNQESIWIR
jgi:hypothetical protein